MNELRAALTLAAGVTVVGWLVFASCYLIDLAGKRRRWAERRLELEADRLTDDDWRELIDRPTTRSDVTDLRPAEEPAGSVSNPNEGRTACASG